MGNISILKEDFIEMKNFTARLGKNPGGIQLSELQKYLYTESTKNVSSTLPNKSSHEHFLGNTT